MRVSVERAAKDFNLYLARKHAHSRGEYNFNYAQLAAEINEFRLSHYTSVSSSEIPEVAEIEKEVRKLWGVKAQTTRAERAAARAARKVHEAEMARQYVLPF